MLSCHKNEKEIIEAKSTGSYNNVVLTKLINLGDYWYNSNPISEGKEKLVARKLNHKKDNRTTNDESQLPDMKSGDEYVPCEGCFKSFKRDTLRRHDCPYTNKVSDARGLLQGSQALIPDVHPTANLRLRNLVLSIMQRGEIRDIVKIDETLIAYGNDLINFHTKDQDVHMVSHNLRTLADMYRRVKATCPEINEFSDIFKDRARANNLSVAMQEMAGRNEETGTIQKGNNIRDYSALLSKFMKFYKLYLVERHATSLISEFEMFNVVLDGKFKLLNRQARNCLVEKAKYQAPQKIPKVSDIQKLCAYIQEKHDEAFDILNKGFDYQALKTLNETGLLLIFLFNRKRQGEISRLLRNDLLPHCIYRLDDNCTGDEYIKLDKNSKAAIREYIRLAITNKKGLKNVGVIMHENLLKSINLILSYRDNPEAGIRKGNKYVFAKASNNVYRDMHYMACEILREYAKGCGVAEPELLRGTELRKQLATMMFGMKIPEESLKYLANFMGHEYEIHKAYYRQKIPIQELAIIAPLLEMAQGLTSRSTISHDNAKSKKVTNSQESANPQAVINKQSHLDESNEADASTGSLYEPDSSALDTAESENEIQEQEQSNEELPKSTYQYKILQGKKRKREMKEAKTLSNKMKKARYCDDDDATVKPKARKNQPWTSEMNNSIAKFLETHPLPSKISNDFIEELKSECPAIVQRTTLVIRAHLHNHFKNRV